ncbi:MAG: TonB-dependent receptor, partial [Pseudomonadota bacterium]
NYQITPNWRLDGTLALLETEITGSADPTVQDGNDVPYAPAVSYSLGAEYQTDMALFGADGQFAARIGYAFTGKRKADLQNRIDLESYGVLDLRVGWSNARMDLYAFVENALDEDYIESAGLFGVGPDGTPVTASTPGQRRKIGVGANVRF